MMSKINDLWKIIKLKLFTPDNEIRAMEAVANAAQSAADKARVKEAGLSKEDYKGGELTIITVCIIAILSGVVSGAVSSGVNTRSIVHRAQITVKDSPGATVTVDFGTNVVEVSGSGGVSLPVNLTGGGK